MGNIPASYVSLPEGSFREVGPVPMFWIREAKDGGPMTGFTLAQVPEMVIDYVPRTQDD